MTADFHNFDAIAKTEKMNGPDQKLSENPINAQMQGLRESDPKGYIANLKQMDNAGQAQQTYPKLELLDANALSEKKQALLKEQANQAEAEAKNGADQAKKFSENGGGPKDKTGNLQDFSVKDLEIKIKLDVTSTLTKTPDVALPSYTIYD